MRLAKLLIVALTAAMSAGFAATAKAAEKPPIFTGLLSNTAVGGFDAVSYFSGHPHVGSRDFVATYMGVEWRFASAENLATFEANPAAYAPQYGGYCAWAVAQGYTAKGDPNFWRIVDGKLYLNFNASVQKSWEEDIPGFIAQANENWPGVLSD